MTDRLTNHEASLAHSALSDFLEFGSQIAPENIPSVIGFLVGKKLAKFQKDASEESGWRLINKVEK